MYGLDTTIIDMTCHVVQNEAVCPYKKHLCLYTQALSYTAVGVATYLALGSYVQRINLLANHLSAVQTFEGPQTGNLHVTSYQKFDNIFNR